MFGPDVVEQTADELLTRLLGSVTTGTALIIENDLLDRAVLALLWRHRASLRVYLLAEDATDRNILALHSGITSVRSPSTVEVVSAAQTTELVSAALALVWAIAADRTASHVVTVLQQREKQITYLPFFEPLTALGNQVPNQAVAAHELILRDIIRDHARFLNFFGDRHNPRDLYERSKYPDWIIPPHNFVAGFPKLLFRVHDADSKVLATTQFEGVLELGSAHILENHRATVELAPILEVLDPTPHDLTI